MKRYLLLLTTIAFAATSWAQEKPNFSGTWKLDTLRSRFEKDRTPKSRVMKIDHQESTVRITLSEENESGQIDETYNLALNATEGQEAAQLTTASTAAAASGSAQDTQKASARWNEWNDGRLVFELTRDTPKGPVTYSRLMRLGEKGGMLTTVLTVRGSAGEHKGYEFFFKQP